jgi:hypothetical protein
MERLLMTSLGKPRSSVPSECYWRVRVKGGPVQVRMGLRERKGKNDGRVISNQN